MDICIILERPDTVDSALDLLEERSRNRHRIRRIAVRDLTLEETLAQEGRYPLADLYLLKSDRSQAITLGQQAEQRGAMVVNNTAATALCRDRTALSRYMEEAQIPWPRTSEFDSLDSLLADKNQLASLPFPGIVKSQYTFRGDLVTRVDTHEDLQALAAEWGQEPIIYQEFAVGDGWDLKMWIVDQQIFAARRRSPLDSHKSRQTFQLDEDEIEQDLRDIALAVGRAFNLQIYGIDFIMTKRGPLVIDINAFHSCFGIIGIDDALVNYIEQLLETLPVRSS